MGCVTKDGATGHTLVDKCEVLVFVMLLPADFCKSRNKRTGAAEQNVLLAVFPDTI